MSVVRKARNKSPMARLKITTMQGSNSQILQSRKANNSIIYGL